MGNRTPTTFAKRQREMEQKRRTAERLRRKIERRNNPGGDGEEPPMEICRPFTDE